MDTQGTTDNSISQWAGKGRDNKSDTEFIKSVARAFCLQGAGNWKLTVSPRLFQYQAEHGA